MKNVYDITNEFEKRLADYTGAPYVVTVDNQSNALFLALMYEKYVELKLQYHLVHTHRYHVKSFMLVPK